MRDLNWSDERYVRFYRSDTPDWLSLSWQARGLYALLRRIADRAGIIRLGRSGKRGVAATVHAAHDADAVLVAFDELERDGWVEFAEAGSGSGPCLVIPDFIESEEAQASDNARQRAKRERERDKTRAAAVRTYNGASTNNVSRENVTQDGNAKASRKKITPEHHADASPAVTQERHSVPSVPSGRSDLPPNVVAALPSLAREPGDDFVGGTNQSTQTSDGPPTAKSVPTPKRDAITSSQESPVVAPKDMPMPIGSSAPQIPTLKTNVVAPAGRATHRPRFEPQRFPNGQSIIDPKTGEVLVLDLNALTPEQVQAERARCIAAMEQAKPPSTPKPKSSHPREEPAKKAQSVTDVATSYPVATTQLVPTPEDPEAAMAEMLAAAPKPICFLAGRSAMRLASVLVGTSVRVTDIPPALQAAALKLDRRFERLTEQSPEHELEELHRFVAGFVGRAHMYRKSTASAPNIPAATEAGDRFVKAFSDAYKKRFGKEYHAAEDDPMHGTAITTSLGQRLRSEAESEEDVQRIGKRMRARLFEQWFDDQFAAKCGYSLKQLARLLVSEPNRFSFGAEPKAHGASGMRPDIGPTHIPQLPPEMQARHDETIGQVGSPAKKEPHETKATTASI